MAITFPLPKRNTVNLELPTFTLDVNQIPIKAPVKRPRDLYGLGGLEWNYFEHHKVELCVTPETRSDITQGVRIESLGSAAYQRYLKSELYKRRPPEATLQLSNAEANELWSDMRSLLWPSVKNSRLTPGQIADVNQIFYHTVSSGSTADNSVFVTLDGNFLGHATPLYERYGVTVLDPNNTWGRYQPRYNLQEPTTGQLDNLWNRQQQLFSSIQVSSGW